MFIGIFAEYVANLEKELTSLKKKHRNLEYELQAATVNNQSEGKASRGQRVTSDENRKSTKDAANSNIVTSHLDQLSEEIGKRWKWQDFKFVLRACIVSVTSGKLRSEKVEMMALCRKQQVRIELLDRHIDQPNKEVRIAFAVQCMVILCIGWERSIP